MIDVAACHWDTIQKILAQHVPACEVWAFGSRVKGNARKYSDLDLAVIGPAKLPRKIAIELKEAFEESNLPFRVDVVDWHTVSKSFQKLIKEKYAQIKARG